MDDYNASENSANNNKILPAQLRPRETLTAARKGRGQLGGVRGRCECDVGAGMRARVRNPLLLPHSFQALPEIICWPGQRSRCMR